MVNSNPPRKEREQACTACPDKCNEYTQNKRPSYSPSQQMTFKLKNNPDLLYTICSNHGNHKETTKVAESPVQECAPEQPEEQKAEREETTEKKDDAFRGAFNGNRKELLNMINNYHKMYLKVKDRKFADSVTRLVAQNEYLTLRWEEKKELLKKVDKPKNVADLEQRLHEAYDYLKIPIAKETEIVDRMIDYDKTMCQQYLDSFIDQFYVFANMSKNPEPMRETYEHSVRCALYSIKVSEFLGFDEDSKVKFFCASLLHDIGKFRVFNGEKKSYRKLKPEMKKHVLYGAAFTDIFGEDISAAINEHHSHQPDGYGGLTNIKTTDESFYLSKLLAVIDFYDSASTRKNKKLLSIWDSLLGKVLPSGDKVRKELVDSYGGLYIDYSGTMLPQSNKKGKLLIDELYQKGIFGNENPLNPFPDKESFRCLK